jgi:iron(III) transport system permease protein
MDIPIEAKLRVGRLGMAKVTQQQFALPVILFVTAILVATPLLMLIRTSLLPPKTLPFDTGELTFANFILAYGDPATIRLLYNTFVYAFGSVLLGLGIASTLAWLVERSDLPLRKTVRVLMFIKMPIPPLALAFGWILLLNPNNGAINVYLKNLFGLAHSVFDVYTLSMMIFIAGTGIVPTMFIMLCGVFRNMDPQLEAAGAVSGANFYQRIRRITLPLLSPGVLSVGIYMLMIMVQAFEGPLAIGLTAGVPVLSVNIYLLSTPEGATPRYGIAAAFGMGLLALALLLMWAYHRLTRVGEKFRVVTGKGFRPKRSELGLWRYPALAFVGFYFCLLLAPLLILVWTSFLPFYQVPSSQALNVLSWANYRSVFESSTIRRSLGNTVTIVAIVSTVTMVLSALISWFAIRMKGRAARWLDTLAFAPLAIPNIVIALSILLLYIRTPLFGSVWIIVIAQVTAFLAFGSRTMNGALIQIHPELENAATASGATWLTTMRKILLPLLLPHFLNGWLWAVSHSMRDVTMALTLMSSDNTVVSSMLWVLWSFGDLPTASALLILMVFGLMLIVAPVQIYASRKSETS